MNKNVMPDYRDVLPDWLPPAMVKDWRQMLRSPLYLLGVLGLVLVGGLAALGEVHAELSPDSFFELAAFGAILLCGVLPARVSLAVAAEVREVGTNFVRLTPLGSRQVVWGTWLSGMVQAVLLVLLALPVVGMRMCCAPAGLAGVYLLAHGALLVMLLAQAAVMIAAAQATATMPPLARVVGALVLFWATMMIPCQPMVDLVMQKAGAWQQVLLHLLVCAVITLTLLEEARRHYAHAAENCAATARGCSLLALVVYGVLLGCAAGNLHAAWNAYVWAGILLVTVAVWDMLHPVGGGNIRLVSCRWLPGGLQRPGLWGGALWFTVAVVLCFAAVVPLVCLQYEQMHADWAYWIEHAPYHRDFGGNGLSCGEILLVFGHAWLDVLVGLLAMLWVSSLFPRQRGAAFLGVMLVEFVAWCALGSFGVLPGQYEWSLVSVLPILQPNLLFGLDQCFYPIGWSPENAVDFYWLVGVKLVWLVVLLGLFRARKPAR